MGLIAECWGGGSFSKFTTIITFAVPSAKSTEELRRECEHLNTELYRLIHKYQGLRLIVQELSESFQDSRLYPILPRYSLLKAMIKRVLRAPAFAEVCHEPYE